MENYLNSASRGEGQVFIDEADNIQGHDDKRGRDGQKLVRFTKKR